MSFLYGQIDPVSIEVDAERVRTKVKIIASQQSESGSCRLLCMIAARNSAMSMV